MLGEKYFLIMSRLSAIQQQIEDIKPYWDIEKELVNKVKVRFEELEKFMLEEFIAFRKKELED